MNDAVINRNPHILGGTPVFTGTRGSVRLEYLEDGDSLDEFLQQYPSVSREQAVQLIRLATETFVIEQISL